MVYLYYLNNGDMAELVDATDLKGPNYIQSDIEP